MKTKKILFASAALVLTLILSGCYLPGTGWVHIYNDIGANYAITDLYLYELDNNSNIGSDLLDDDTSEFLDFGEYVAEYNLQPGTYAVQGAGMGYSSGFFSFIFSTTLQVQADDLNIVSITPGDTIIN